MSDQLKLKSICELILENFPDPQTELDYKNDFTLLIAIILSAQTTDKMVNIATRDFFEKFQTPQELLNIGEDEILSHLKVLNYYKTKTKNILKTAAILIEKHNSKVPSSFDELIQLAGVGRKTANVFLNIWYNVPTIAVDTHVFRTTNRIFGMNFKTPEQVENFLIKLNTHDLKTLTHHLLILHGRYICKAKKPDCENCNIQSFCKTYKP